MILRGEGVVLEAGTFMWFWDRGNKKNKRDFLLILKPSGDVCGLECDGQQVQRSPISSLSDLRPVAENT